MIHTNNRSQCGYLIILGLFETATIILKYPPKRYESLSVDEFEIWRETYYRHKV